MSTAPGPFNLADTLNQALTLHRQGRLDDAEKLYSRVLKADRDQFDALNLLGALNQQRGRLGEAQRLLTAALKVNPRSADALSNMAMVLHALHRNDEALESLDRALAIVPNLSEALNNRGIILLDLGRPDEALRAFDGALAAEPRHLQARINRGNALSALDRNEEAIPEYDAALAAAPGHPLAHYNRGNALHALGRETEAIAAYDQALAAAPAYVNAWMNRGMALASLNRHQEALSSYAKVREIAPDSADVHFNAALSLLTIGDYRRGFAEYERRWTRTGMGVRKDIRAPLWLGETPLGGKTILLHAEQGLGDTVMFARYAPLLARAGASVVLEVQAPLKTLLDGMEGIDAVIARGEALPRHDVQCPLASLPLAMKTELHTIPADIPYLRASARHLEKWRQRLQALPSPRVALAWSGSATNTNDKRRSLTLAQLDPLLAMPGIRFVSIQRELRDADAGPLKADRRITHLGEGLDDFADTAAVLTLVDCLVCADTSVAHVAGALGRPAIVMVPLQPDWRWTLDRERGPWYPTVRLIRQPSFGDWASVIENVRAELARTLG